MSKNLFFISIFLLFSIFILNIFYVEVSADNSCVSSSTKLCDENEVDIQDNYDIEYIEFINHGDEVGIFLSLNSGLSGLEDEGPLFLYFADEPGSANRLIRIYHDRYTLAYASGTAIGFYEDSETGEPEINNNIYNIKVPLNFVAPTNKYFYAWAYWMHSKDRAPDTSYFYFKILNDDACNDEDGGTEYYKYGAVFTQNNLEPSVIDQCKGNIIQEGVCASAGGASAMEYTCPYGCEAGECICPETYHVLASDGRCVWSCGSGTTPDLSGSECVCKEGYQESGLDQYDRRICTLDGDASDNAIVSSSACIDMDMGDNIYEKGKIIQGLKTLFVDHCSDEMHLNEYYCEGASAYSKSYYCEGGCALGKCLKVDEGMPDLLITNVVYDPEEPKAGETITYYVSVKNIGKFDIDEEIIKLSNGGSVSGLKAGETKIIIDKFGLTNPGYNLVNIMVNASRSVAESNYENNDYNLTINILSTEKGDGEHKLRHWESVQLGNGFILKVDGTNTLGSEPYSIYYRVYDQNYEMIGSTPNLEKGDSYSGNGFELDLKDIEVFSPGNSNYLVSAEYTSSNYLDVEPTLPDLMIEDIEFRDGKIGVRYCNTETAVSSKVIYIKMEAGNTIISGFGSNSIYPLRVPDPNKCLFFGGYEPSKFNIYDEDEMEVSAIIDFENYLNEKNEENNKFIKTLKLNNSVSDASHEEVKEEEKQENAINLNLNHLNSDSRIRIETFLLNGVDANTMLLGEGERTAVIESYKEAFGKYPETENDMSDAIRIANGRWPEKRNIDMEKEAWKIFMEIYKRIPDQTNPNDNSAVVVMAYGLRQKAENRNLESEKQGIKIFKNLYLKLPETTLDWNIMQAIAYSGAVRMSDKDKDMLPDTREVDSKTNSENPDTDGDGYLDGIEVLYGYDPLES